MDSLFDFFENHPLVTMFLGLLINLLFLALAVGVVVFVLKVAGVL